MIRYHTYYELDVPHKTKNDLREELKQSDDYNIDPHLKFPELLLLVEYQ